MAESPENLYVNDKYEFSIVWPKKWIKLREEDYKNRIGQKEFAISYQKFEKSQTVMDLPVFGLFIEAPRSSASTALEIAWAVFHQWRHTEKEWRTVEGPAELEVNGISGARFVWDKPAWDGNKKFWVRIVNIYLVREKYIVHFTLFCRPEEFQDNYQEIEKSLNTFRFI